MAKPALLAAVFSAVSFRMRVDSWPLTIAFSLTFFLESIVELVVSSYNPSNDLSRPPDARNILVYLGAMIFSPFTLWAPMIFGTSTYAILRRFGLSFRGNGRDASAGANESE